MDDSTPDKKTVGVRMTKQKKWIMEALGSEPKSAEEIFRLLVKAGKKIDITTIYRNLETLLHAKKVFVGSLFIVVYLFVMQPNQVKGASMDPTFNSGDYIFTSKVTYKIRSFHRGDVVVFKSPHNPDIEYIKRVIGLSGDQVMIKDSEVYVNGQQLREEYIADKTNLWEGGYSKNGEAVTVPDGMIFVMGDNRPRSSDSREFGPIPIESVIGQVFYRYFPPSKMGVIENPFPENFQSRSLPFGVAFS